MLMFELEATVVKALAITLLFKLKAIAGKATFFFFYIRSTLDDCYVVVLNPTQHTCFAKLKFIKEKGEKSEFDLSHIKKEKVKQKY